MKPKALVTGACGFIGSHLVDRLVEEGWEVRATDLPRADRRWLNPAAEWTPADLTDRAAPGPVVRGMDAVFHVAAIHDPFAPWEHLYRANVLGTENLLESARKAGVRRVVSLSCYEVYGRALRGRQPVDETTRVRPRDPLGRAKAMQDAVVWRYHHDLGLPATVLRPSQPYGPRARRGIAAWFRRMSRLAFIPIPLDRTRKVASVHVRDVVRAACFVAQQEDTIGQEYNLTDHSPCTLEAFLRLVARALGKRTAPVFVPSGVLLTGTRIARYGRGGWIRLKGEPNRPAGNTSSPLIFDFVPPDSKIASTGFRFDCSDPAAGITETIEALRREGFLD